VVLFLARRLLYRGDTKKKPYFSDTMRRSLVARGTAVDYLEVMEWAK
jgi:hypothetical protein